MAKVINNGKWVVVVFALLAGLALLTPFWVFKDLLFPYITSKAYFLRITVELALPFYVYLVLKRSELRPSFKNPLNIAVLAFLVFNIISSVVGINPLKSFWGNFERMGGSIYLFHLVLIYFYLVLLGQYRREYIRRFLLAVIYLGATTALYGLMVKITGNHFIMNDPSYPRVSATFGNPIFFASFLILPMILTIYYLLIEGRVWLKIFYGFIAATELWCILLSQTRGAIVGLALGAFISALIYIIVTPQKKVRLWGGVGILFFCLLVGVAFTQQDKFTPGSMMARVLKLKDTNTEARLVQWGVALKGYKNYPIFGVGPENYYFISNANYNPDIYKYDVSWFDKPHNYMIEVLVTTGAVGFIAYVLMLLACVWSLALAYRKGLFSLLESCLLLAGFLAYSFQNLFVFDTISASLMFYIFLGFTGYLWQESMAEENPNKKTLVRELEAGFVNTATVIVAIGTAYIIYIGNITGLIVAKNINYGYAYAAVDPQIAKTYFQQAEDSSFDFDPIQFASKYAETAINLAGNPGSQTPDFVAQNLQDAIRVSESAVARVSNDPTAWQQLANLYLSQSIINKTGISPKTVEAAQMAMNLAPQRPEPILMMARVDIYENKVSEAESLLKDLIASIPQDNDAKLQLALMYMYTGQTDKALETGRALLDAGYIPNQPAQIDWMAQAYEKKEDYASAAMVYEISVKVQPSNLNDLWALAQVYVKLGKKDEAKKIAENLIAQDPKDTAHFQSFIDSIK